MGRPSKFSPEVRERAVRLVLGQQEAHASQWAAIESITGKIGCTAETLRKWVRRAECDQGVCTGLTSSERERLKAQEREIPRAAPRQQYPAQCVGVFRPRQSLDHRPK